MRGYELGDVEEEILKKPGFDVKNHSFQLLWKNSILEQSRTSILSKR